MAREISLELIVRETELAPAAASETPIQELFRLLVEDDERTARSSDNVLDALAEGRRCLVLSQWKEHCRQFPDGVRARGPSPLVLEDGLGKRARAAIRAQINGMPPDHHVLVATGQYLGEGFDCPQLDALLLAFPLSFKGRLVQYTGRHADQRRQDQRPRLRLRRHPRPGTARADPSLKPRW